MNPPSVFSVLIAALGGEGGGVLADWLVQCARTTGLAAQATSVPGVAQRTGATSYYIEWQARPSGETPVAPVFALSPTAGRVDVVIASEWLEAARTMERGFVTPERTTLIASTSRVYTTAEKMHMADGRYDGDRIAELARALARQAILMDMQDLTVRHDTVVSSVMFGALAGSGVLPWSVNVCEDVIRSAGKGVAASLAGFHAAFAAAQGTGTASALASTPALEQIVTLGVERCRDYQDESYALLYRQRVAQALPQRPLQASEARVWTEAVRHLALWMCYEDVIRVADLKTRRQRFERIQQEVQARPGELVRVTEHFKPGVEEVASILPQALGERLLAWAARRPGRTGHLGLHIRSTSLWGYLMLRTLARLRPWRRHSLRYAQEHAAMDIWWSALQQLAPQSDRLAFALGGLPQVLKGYGDTLLRGRENYERLWRECVAPVLAGERPVDEAAAVLEQALKATLADPEGRLNAGTREHPVQWFKTRPV